MHGSYLYDALVHEVHTLVIFLWIKLITLSSRFSLSEIISFSFWAQVGYSGYFKFVHLNSWCCPHIFAQHVSDFPPSPGQRWSLSEEAGNTVLSPPMRGSADWTEGLLHHWFCIHLCKEHSTSILKPVWARRSDPPLNPSGQ